MFFPLLWILVVAVIFPVIFYYPHALPIETYQCSLPLIAVDMFSISVLLSWVVLWCSSCFCPFSLASLKAGTEDQLNHEKDNLKVVLWRLYNAEMLLLAFENGIDSLYYSLYGIEGPTEVCAKCTNLFRKCCLAFQIHNEYKNIRSRSRPINLSNSVCCSTK